MKLLLYCILSYISITTSRSSLFSNIKSLIKDNDEGNYRRRAIPRAHLQKRMFDKDIGMDDKAHFQKDAVLNSFRRHRKQKQRPTFEINLNTDENSYVEYPVPNSLRKDGKQKPRRTFEINMNTDENTYVGKDTASNSLMKQALKISRRRGSSGEMASTSSSREFKDWKDEWKEIWIQKKFEAVNSSYVPGDTVNMLNARPWGVPCGDPNQHDMPWGTCMLPIECDAEYRIYRGDYACGRTQFICCAMQLTVYDMYEGFDLSFEDSGLETDTQEKLLKGSKEDQKKHRQLMKKKRKAARQKRKRLVERQIKKIQKEIRTIIKNQERNATSVKKRKTRQLKRFYDMLKRQYQKDRKGVADIHELDMIQMDDVLKKKLEQIRQMNVDFIKNATFRDIVVNGTLNRQSARMLMEAYPELQNYIHLNVKRRSGGGEAKDYLDYDVEYGMLYF